MLGHCRLVLFWFFLYHSTTTVHAEANVTLDDGDSRITYSPPGAWTKSAQSQLDYGGSHMLSQNPNATAVVNFTGTAVYFLSPLWPYKVNTAISLDSSPYTLIDLVDHSKSDTSQGSETVPSSVVWSATKLSNTQHSLQISVGSGQSYAIVDAVIYTDPSANPSSSSRVVAGPTYASSSESSHRKSVVPIVVGVLFGLMGAVLVCVAIWYFWRRKRRRDISATDAVQEGGYYVNGPEYGFAYGPPSAYTFGPQGPAPPPPYPPYTYGNYGISFPPPGPPDPPYPGVPPNRAPNRYQPGYTLSTITEKSTPQMVDGARSMPGTPMSGGAAAIAAAAAATVGAHSPASLQSDVGYYTAPGSSVSHHSPAAGQPLQQIQEEFELQQHQHHQHHIMHNTRPFGITSQMQMDPDYKKR